MWNGVCQYNSGMTVIESLIQVVASRSYVKTYFIQVVKYYTGTEKMEKRVMLVRQQNKVLASNTNFKFDISLQIIGPMNRFSTLEERELSNRYGYKSNFFVIAGKT